jgi:hypothetical protein
MSQQRYAAIAAVMLGLGGPGSPDPVLAQSRDRDKITREEILNSAQKQQDLYLVVRGLRPHFLLPPRGVRSISGRPAPAVLYINGNRMGELIEMRKILATDVHEVRYLDPGKAENEFGVRHSGGAVLVTLIKGLKSDERIP